MVMSIKGLLETNHEAEFQQIRTWALDARAGGIMAGAAVATLHDELVELKQSLTTHSHVEKTEQITRLMALIDKAMYSLQIIQKGMKEGKLDGNADFYLSHISTLKEIYKSIIQSYKEIDPTSIAEL